MTDSTMQVRIMLIVGDEMDSELLSFQFSAAGFTVIVPTEHQLAVEEAMEQIPDIVFIDIDLPDRAAFAIAERFRQSPGMESIWLVALGGGADPAMQDAIGDAGFLLKLPKEAGFDDLNWLANRKAQLKHRSAGRFPA